MLLVSENSTITEMLTQQEETTLQGFNKPWQKLSLHSWVKTSRTRTSHPQKVWRWSGPAPAQQIQSFHHFCLPSFPLPLPAISSRSVLLTGFSQITAIFLKSHFLSQQLGKRIKTASTWWCFRGILPSLDKAAAQQQKLGALEPSMDMLSWIHLVSSLSPVGT